MIHGDANKQFKCAWREQHLKGKEDTNCLYPIYDSDSTWCLQCKVEMQEKLIEQLEQQLKK